MKKRNAFFLTCMLSIALPAGSNAQWERSNGLDGAYVNALSVNGTYLFAGTPANGVFRSADSGASWLGINTGLTDLNIRAIEKWGTYLFAGTFGGGVFRSADNGASWQPINTGISTLNIQALGGNDSFLFAGTSGGGVCRTPDNGEHWLEVSNGLVHINIFSIGITNNYVFAGTWGSSAFRTADNGQNWFLVTNGLYDPSENIIPYCFAAADTFLFTGTGGGGIFRAKDSARAWYPFNTGLPATAFVTALARVEDTLFAATENGVFRSINNGATANWVPDNTGLTDTVVSLTVSGSVIYAGTNGSGVWRRLFSATAIPSSPVLSIPGNAGTNITITPTLSWNTVVGASTYTVQVSTVADFTTQVVNQSGITATSYAANGLLNGTTYYWRVIAANGGGSSAWSATWSFVTVVPVPIVPVPAAPVNAGANIATAPTLTWNSAIGAATYVVQISTVADFATQVVNQSGITATSYAASGLLNGTTYYWRVSAANGGGSSAWSAVWNFVTVVAAPIVPVPAAPVNAATNIAIAPTLTWNTVVGASTYTVQVSTVADFATQVVNQSGITATSYAASGLLNGTTYYWRVSAANGGGSSAWSAVWNFVTVVAAPIVPVPAAPVNAATNIAIAPTLTWNTVVGASTYTVQVSTVADFATQVVNQSGITATSYAASGLLNGTTYYWRVSAANGGGSSAWSAVWNFVTVVAAPIVPVPAAPVNAATNIAIAPTLSWNTVAGASTYTIQISTALDFATQVVNQSGITATSYTASSLLNSTTYYWRVNAANVGGTGAWSAVFSFVTIANSPLVPILTAPANAASNTPTAPVLTWNTVTGASAYTVQVSTAADFATQVVNQIGIIATSYTASSLLNSTTYYWRVNATNAGGTGAWSAASSFVTIASPPSTPVLTAPANAATNTPTGSILTWNTVIGASTYTVQVSTIADFATHVVNQSGITATSYAASGLLNGTTYFWRVNAANGGGNSAWSTAWSFVTVAASPLVPVPTAPVNAGTDITLTPTLTWNTVVGASTYTVQVSTAADFATQVVNQSGITATSYAASGLLNGTTYFWRVNAANAGGTGAWSDNWSFTTIIDAPAIPATVSPDSGALDVTCVLSLLWHSGQNAASYHFQLSANASFAPLLLDSSDIRDTLLALDHLSNSSTYFWRVSSVNAALQSLWSGVRSFTTICTVPAAVAVLSHGNDTLKTDSLLCTWATATPNITSYHLQIFSDSAHTVLTFSDSTITDTGFVIRNLHNNQTFWWRVRARNIAGFGPFSTITPVLVRIPTTAIAPAKLTVALNGSSIKNGVLRYGIPKQCAVSIVVYDILGRSVWNYASSNRQPGYYMIDIHMNDRSAGRYFLQFVAGDYRRIVPFIKN